MTQTHRERVEALFAEALDRPPERWASYLAAAVEDSAMSIEVLSLLRAHQGRGRFDSIADELRGVRPAAGSVPAASLLARLRIALSERYTIERELGRGGMATVYLAEDLKHHRPVAIKVLSPELAATLGRARFLREIGTAARLNHPHILSLHDSGEADGLIYYVMPYVEGESLRQRLAREHQLPIQDALRIATEVAAALEYAHQHGVIHRDIKPENILLQGDDVLVADFGIARAITAAGSERLTETGIAVGTPAYMSPEQGAASPELDGRSDLYSLGCVLYEMLTGHPPFTGGTAREVLARHSLDVVPVLTAARPAVPPAVERAVNTALAKVPADRFRTVAQFAEALTRRDAAAMPATPPAAAARTSRRRWRVALLTLGVVVVGAVLLRLRFGKEAPAYERTAIAVLPFQNLSAEAAQAYLASGLHDEILTQLSKVAALKVISRTSVMGYAGTRTPLRQIARELGVGSVVEGSVEVVGKRLRVNVQLIDATTDAHLWVQGYDRTLGDAFAIQSDVAQEIVAAVGAALSSSERQGLAAAPTTNPDAYQFLLQGNEYYYRPYSRENMESAEQLYERALALDSGFALAHAQLSMVHGDLYWLQYDPSPARAAKMRAEAAAALRLRPNLPEAHLAIGRMYYRDRRDYRRALDEFVIALKGEPNSARMWRWVGYVQRRLGLWDEAFAAYEKSVALDPRNASGILELGGTSYSLTHHYAEAVRASDRALALAPDYYQAAESKGWDYVHWQGQFDTLRAVMSRIPIDADVGPTPVQGDLTDLTLWERNTDSLLHLVRTARVRVFPNQVAYVPMSLYAAWAHQLRGEQAAAHAAFDSARVFIDSVARERPDDERVHAALGLALAGLGRREEALREAEWLSRSAVYRQDAVDGPVFAEARAQILAQAGDVEAALREIEGLLARPSWTSVNGLRLNPRWDAIRNDPRFQALLVKYARQEQVH